MRARRHARLRRVSVLGELLNDVVDGGTRVHGHSLAGGEDDHGNLSIAQDRELSGLLDQAAFSLNEGDLSVALILDPHDLNLSAAHGSERTESRTSGRLQQ